MLDKNIQLTEGIQIKHITFFLLFVNEIVTFTDDVQIEPLYILSQQLSYIMNIPKGNNMKNLFIVKPSRFIVLLAILLLTFGLFQNIYCQNNEQRYKSIDVLDYKFEIALNDSSDIIKVIATVKILFKEKLKSYYLDLSNINKDGKGMIIENVFEDNQKLEYTHRENKVEIIDTAIAKGCIRTYRLKYHGIPSDGLIISKNKFGDRVFFGDCWPNRAHCWLSCVDHPSDKATVEFIVVAPSHYQVIANGSNIEDKIVGDKIISHWMANEPLPTKVMVIGVARFAIQNFTSTYSIPLSTWVFPQNQDEGFKNYRAADKPLDYYISQIGAYPFSKLANVQSKTIFGGMENASCIFYYENSVTRAQESLLAHEIAHQWFGDAISELSWYHIWLSEGFATYLTDLYIEHQYGRDRFLSRMNRERNEVFEYESKKLAPIVDTTITDLNDLLSVNSYQKAAWVLHMLRKDLGDSLFWECIRTFYQKNKYGNALTKDFQAIVENLSGKDYHEFFNQWFYQCGHPKLSSDWSYANKQIKFTVNQQQKGFTFKIPLEIEIVYDKGNSTIETVNINNAEDTFTLPSEEKPKEIILDPNTWLLFELVKNN